MKTAVLCVVLALLVPFCLAYCDPTLTPADVTATSGNVPCTVPFVYSCQDESQCDGIGGCLTCTLRSDAFTFVNIQGTACCNQSYTIAGEIWGDPHLTGFDGEKFDFQGIPNTWFNLLSTEHLQLNGFFQPTCGQKGTHITAVSLQVNGSKIFISPDSASVDGKELTCCKGWTPIPLNGGALRHQWVNHFEVETEHFLMKFERFLKDDKKDCIKANFNLEFKLKNYLGAIHGVIGQTAHHPLTGNAPEVEGKVADYVVSGPFATDSKFNFYNL